MKKKSVSFQTSEKSVETKLAKKEKNLIKFDIEASKLSCFISKSANKPKDMNRTITESEFETAELQKKNLQQKPIALSELKIARGNREKSISYIDHSSKTFNNKLLFMDYEQQEVYIDSSKTFNGPFKDSFTKTQEEDDSVTQQIAYSCMRVITEETDHSSNPISAHLTPQNLTPTSSSSFEIPMMMQNYYYGMSQQPAARNKKTVSYEESRDYIVDLAKIELDGRTTIMVRNIPNKYSQDMLLDLFEKNHKKKFDFFYLPIDYNNNCNVGYAFLNFIHTKFIYDFYNEFHCRKWNKFNSVKVCNVCYARIQGTAQLENHFEHSNVLQQRERRYRPLIGVRMLNENINQLVQRQQQENGAITE